MPLPRKKDDGSSGAPVLDILNAHVRLTDVEEYVEPYTVTRKSDGRTFLLDPAFNVTVEVIDDGQGGDDNGTKFFETFKYKNTQKDGSGDWINQENSKLGALTEVVNPAPIGKRPSNGWHLSERLPAFLSLCSQPALMPWPCLASPCRAGT